MHWVLCQFTPATNRHAGRNGTEFGFSIFVVIFSLLVIGLHSPLRLCRAFPRAEDT